MGCDHTDCSDVIGTMTKINRFWRGSRGGGQNESKHKPAEAKVIAEPGQASQTSIITPPANLPNKDVYT